MQKYVVFETKNIKQIEGEAVPPPQDPTFVGLRSLLDQGSL